MKKKKIKFINNQYESFKELYENIYFVDKTNIIKKFNEIVNTPVKNVCITNPRRFGKSSIASMIVAYYSKRKKEEFKEIFDNLNISKEENITTSKEDKNANNTSEKKIINSKKKKIKI